MGEGWYEYDRVRHAEADRARAGRGRRARRDALRDARAVLPSRPHAAVRRRRRRRRRRARRRRRPRSEPGRRRTRARAPPRRGDRGRAPRRPRRTPPERGVARRGRRSAGRSSRTRRPSRSTAASPSRAAAGCRARSRGGACTSCARPPMPSRSGWGRCGPTRRGSTRATSSAATSRAGSPSAAARCRRGRSSSCAAARSRTSCTRSRAEGVQSLLLEGGPTLATAFLAAGFVDKLLLFVAPVLAGEGPRCSATSSRRSSSSTSARSHRERTCSWRRTCTSRNLCSHVHRHRPRDRNRRRLRRLPARRRAPETAADAAVGDSVAVAGVCLTVVAVRARHGSRSTSSPETLVAHDARAASAPAARVNLEPSLRVGDRLGGHVVQGHVDAVGRVRSVAPERDGRRMWVDAPDGRSLRYCVEKGSIAVDGVSLTVAAFDDDGFEVALIPHTLAVDDARQPRAGRPGQPRGRRAREGRRAALAARLS